MELADKTNVTDSYSKERSRKSKKKAKEVRKTTKTTQQERELASLKKFLEEMAKAARQGAETDSAIAQTQKEHTTAEETARIEKQTAIGTILATGLYGGLSSGVAEGLNNLFGTIGKGAGQQVSSEMGIQPSPSPAPSPTPSPGPSPTPSPQDPFPWTYSGRCGGTGKAKANWGSGGSVRCGLLSASSKVTLHAGGSATGQDSSGFHYTFSEFGVGEGCRPASYSHALKGSHSNGSVNITDSLSGKYSGSYNATSLNLSGGNSGFIRSFGDGKSATIEITKSCTYTRTKKVKKKKPY